MSSFSRGAPNDLDWSLFQNGWVTMYWKTAILDADSDWLASHGYRVHRFATDTWSSAADALRSLGEGLEFPAYYGQNLDALSECLSDLDVPESGGSVVVFSRYDRFADVDRDTAHQILDILAGAARFHMLFGRRLATLVQSDDPRLSFGPLAPTYTSWNRREWLHKDRGL